MNGLLAVAAFVAALNPPRTRLGLPEEANRRIRFVTTTAGVLIGIAILTGIAVAGEPALDALEVSPETFRIAAGLVLVIAAAWMLYRSSPPDEPLAPGRLAALWPVAYPRVVSPESLALSITVGASDGLGGVLPGLAVASGALLLLGAVPTTMIVRRLLAATGRILAVVLVVAGVWLILQGVREV